MRSREYYSDSPSLFPSPPAYRQAGRGERDGEGETIPSSLLLLNKLIIKF